jgi:hypothetical protein
MASPFITPDYRHIQNMTGSAETHARPVLIGGPGGEMPGVGIFRSKYLLSILTEQDATRLADQIIDAVEGT